MTTDGGDAACWLNRVCDACGSLVDADDQSHVCRRSVASDAGPVLDVGDSPASPGDQHA